MLLSFFVGFVLLFASKFSNPFSEFDFHFVADADAADSAGADDNDADSADNAGDYDAAIPFRLQIPRHLSFFTQIFCEDSFFFHAIGIARLIIK